MYNTKTVVYRTVPYPLFGRSKAQKNGISRHWYTPYRVVLHSYDTPCAYAYACATSCPHNSPVVQCPIYAPPRLTNAGVSCVCVCVCVCHGLMLMLRLFYLRPACWAGSVRAETKQTRNPTYTMGDIFFVAANPIAPSSHTGFIPCPCVRCVCMCVYVCVYVCVSFVVVGDKLHLLVLLEYVPYVVWMGNIYRITHNSSFQCL